MGSLLVERYRRMVAYRAWLSRSFGALGRLNPAAPSPSRDIEGEAAGEERGGRRAVIGCNRAGVDIDLIEPVRVDKTRR
jgi:hypothetical protein